MWARPLLSRHGRIGTYDGTRLRIYVNGALASSTPYTTPLANSATNLRIGSGAGIGYPWSGPLDDVRIYNRALSATEVKQLYNSSANTVGHSNVIISNGTPARSSQCRRALHPLVGKSGRRSTFLAPMTMCGPMALL
jgi:hypothetical protein